MHVDKMRTNNKNRTTIGIRSHKEHITARNRYLRYVATIMLWLGISVANYYLLASFNAITLPIGILLFQFEIILWFGSYYVLCRLSHKKPESTLDNTVTAHPLQASSQPLSLKNNV